MASLARPLPLADTVDALRAGRVDLEAHVEGALARVEETAPDLRAFVPEPGRAARVRAEVAALRARRPDPDAVGPPLFGALLGVKDIIAAGGLPTRAGSALPAEVFAMPEATAVSRLRRAGAIVLGKTVTTEFAYLEAGATANPHDPRRTPGGSSSGSAAAVAAGIVPLALGTQTIGSVLRPAAFCGVVGFKPTYGRVPSDGVLPFSRSIDTVGAFTQDVAGAALAAAALVDGWTPAAAPTGRPSLGVPRGPYLEQAQPEGLAAFERALARLDAAGFRVIDVEALADIQAVNERHADLIAAEFADVHRAWFAQWGALYRGGSAGTYDRGRGVSAAARAAGLAGRAELRDALTRRMAAAGIDAWISPAAPGPAPLGLEATGAPRMNLPWTHAGLPAVALPAGTVEGMPVGVQVVARAGDDERLLAWARDIEAALR